MILIMNSPNNDVTLGVFDPNGSILLNPANKWTNWQVTLPLTGLYTIQVTGAAITESYTLTVKVAQVVNFASGTTSTTWTGVLPQTQDYVIEVVPNNRQEVNYSLTVSVPGCSLLL